MMAITLPDILVDAPLWWRVIEIVLILSITFSLGNHLGRRRPGEIKNTIPVGMNNKESFTNDATPSPSTGDYGISTNEVKPSEEIIPEKPVATEDDLTRIEGIGPKLAEILKANGISTYKDLASTSSLTLRKILDNEGPQFKVHDPTYWPRQASLAQAGKWRELEEMQENPE
jgi:predicted flap endonuclease-1-like 5' DNA nuclease